MSYKIYPMPQYEEWYEAQIEKSKFQIEKRLDKIKTEDHFGHICDLGGSKNGQDSDIRKAKNIIAKAKEKAKK